MPEDARYRSKVFLDTYVTAANITQDDDASTAPFVVCYGEPNYPMLKVFKTKGAFVVFAIDQANSKALMDPVSQAPYGYEEDIPIHIMAIDRRNATGTKLISKAYLELKRICEVYPTGSLRSLATGRKNDRNLGSTILYDRIFTMNYRRDTDT